MKRTIIWIGALVVGAVLGLFGVSWLDQLMTFVATVYTRLFQLLAVPTIVLAVITTLASFGSKGYGKIFGRTLTYTLLTTFAAAVVGALLYLLISPGNMPTEAISLGGETVEAPALSYTEHILNVTPTTSSNPSLRGTSSRCSSWPSPSA